jgi:hypothetical protein
MRAVEKSMGSRGQQEIPVIPDEPDVLDANVAPQGLAADGLATGSSSASGYMLLSLFLCYLFNGAVVRWHFCWSSIDH